MKLLDLKTMRGPNYWSGFWHNIIVVRLDIEELEGRPTNALPGFSERLQAAMPSLHEHHCSEGHEGGFLERVAEGTWMAHVIEHIALELQWLAGMKCGFGRTRSTGEKGIYTIAFSYEIPEAGQYAIRAAVRIAEDIIGANVPEIAGDVEQLKKIRERKGLGVSTLAIIEEAKSRNIPVRRINDDSMVVLGQGSRQRRVQASMTCATSGIGVDVACDKQQTKRLLEKAYLPVPAGMTVRDEEDLKEAIEELGFPLVIKPIDGNQGRGITTNICSAEQAQTALERALEISPRVIVERYIKGHDYRFLLVNHKLVAVAQRTPAFVTGDGSSTIGQLIDRLNSDPARGNGHEKSLTTVKVDQHTLDMLAQKNYTLESVPAASETVFLKNTANLSTGGISTDVTDEVHPDNIFMAERVSRIINLDICGIDVVAKDIRMPIDEFNGAILEVNACPGLRMHLKPSVGIGRNVAEPIVSMLFPPNRPSRIPVVAVTGTNGKTTTTRLIAFMAQTAGLNVGYTTTDGIYINGRTICEGDCTGESSAETVLTDPMVDFAVLECARGGILRAGLGFDQCDVSIVTNVAEDHLGLDGINTLKEMSRVKRVVAASTAKDGYAILNAEDDEVYFMGDDLDCNIALFALDAANPRVQRHLAKGGYAAVVENGYVTIFKGKWRTRICSVNEVPLSFSGRAECMIKNILPAALAGVIRRFRISDIRKALRTFVPSPELTPGRFNLFNFGDFEVMVDYAHNPAAFTELKKFIAATPASHKVGIISAPGDRKDEDIRQVGFHAAQMFDELVIRLDKDMRGRPEQQMIALLMEGVHTFSTTLPVSVIADEKEALRYAIHAARPGTLIITFTETVQETLAFVKQEKEKGRTRLVPREVNLSA
jgi:cyanophycin synthetase